MLISCHSNNCVSIVSESNQRKNGSLCRLLPTNLLACSREIAGRDASLSAAESRANRDSVDHGLGRVDTVLVAVKRRFQEYSVSRRRFLVYHTRLLLPKVLRLAQPDATNSTSITLPATSSK